MLAATLFGAPTTFAQAQLQWAETCATTPTCVSNLQLPTTVPVTGWSPHKTLLADLDLDHDTDILSVGPRMQLTRNETVLGAAPGFNAYTDASSQIGVALVDIVDGVLADFDGDGDLDLAVATSTTISTTNILGDVWILRNNARPVVFPSAPILLTDALSSFWTNPPTVTGALTSITAGDFDGDGDADLAVAGPGGVVMFHNVPGSVAGARAFVNASATRIPAAFGVNVLDIDAADLDADGDVDFVIAGGIVVAGVVTAAIHTVGFNPGPTGLFTSSPLPSPVPAVVSISTTVDAADINGDGRIDLAFGHRAKKLSFSAPWTGGELVLFTNGPTPGVFTVGQVFSAPQSGTDIAVGDIDEDGLADIVMSCRTEVVSIQNMGVWTNFFRPGRTRIFSRPAAGSPFADVTAGRIDDDTEITVPFTTTTIPTDGESVALADLDLDLDVDVVVGHNNANRIGVFVNRLWQFETQRLLPFVTDPTPLNPTPFSWPVTYDMYREFGIPGTLGLATAFVAASFDAPVHQFPAQSFGIATVAGYSVVSGIPIQSAQGAFIMNLGPFDAATRNALTGIKVFATCAIFDLASPRFRLTGVVQTTLQ